jgi:hypothetical protein
VPSGDPPLGTGKAPELFRTSVFSANVLSLPSGQWPDGTGGSPVLPIPISEFGFKHGGNGSAEYDSGGIRISIAEKRLPVGICLNLLLEVLKGEAVGFTNSELRSLLNR